MIKKKSQHNPPSAGASFHGVPVEGGVGVWEVVADGAHEPGKHRLALEPDLVVVDVAVHEAVGECGVSVHVDVELHLRVLCQ